MKVTKLFSVLGFLLIATLSLSAQTTLPDANDSACWQSLAALHNCVQAQQDRAMAQAERCTSYPEYQCQPEPEQPRHKQEAKAQKKSQQNSDPGSTTLVVNPVPSGSSSEGH